MYAIFAALLFAAIGGLLSCSSDPDIDTVQAPICVKVSSMLDGLGLAFVTLGTKSYPAVKGNGTKQTFGTYYLKSVNSLTFLTISGYQRKIEDFVIVKK